MPADGMSMLLRLFRLPIIIERCWLGSLRLRSSEGIQVPRGRYANVTEKISISSRLLDNFRKISAIMTPTGQDGYKKRKPSEVNPGKSGRQTGF